MIRNAHGPRETKVVKTFKRRADKIIGAVHTECNLYERRGRDRKGEEKEQE
eukprot:SAG11_NODE_2049_length_3883_cov_5.318446_1_plen_50_part_10